jgi:hypothetical protein
MFSVLEVRAASILETMNEDCAAALTDYLPEPRMLQP